MPVGAVSVLWESAVPSPQSQPRFRSLFPANYRHKGELLREKVLLLKQLLCSAGELRRLRVPSFTRVTGVTRIRERCHKGSKARGALVWGALPAPCTGVCGNWEHAGPGCSTAKRDSYRAIAVAALMVSAVPEAG